MIQLWQHRVEGCDKLMDHIPISLVRCRRADDDIAPSVDEP